MFKPGQKTIIINERCATDSERRFFIKEKRTNLTLSSNNVNNHNVGIYIYIRQYNYNTILNHCLINLCAETMLKFGLLEIILYSCSLKMYM